MSGQGTKTETPGHRVITEAQKEDIAWVRQNEADFKAFMERVRNRVPHTDPHSGESPQRATSRRAVTERRRTLAPSRFAPSPAAPFCPTRPTAFRRTRDRNTTRHD